MLSILSRTALAVVLSTVSTIAVAQTIEPGTAAAPPVPAVAPSPSIAAAPSEVRLPALTVVELVVLDEVSSKTATAGQPVRLTLSSPLYVTPELGLPAGTAVEGIVIHSSRPGMGGKAGELLIGAKRIALSQSLEVPLRSFKLTPARGKNNEATAMGLTIAGGAVGGVAAMFITGGSATAPAGVGARAKTAAEVSIPIALLTKLPLLPTSLTVAAPAPPAVLSTTTN